MLTSATLKIRLRSLSLSEQIDVIRQELSRLRLPYDITTDIECAYTAKLWSVRAIEEEFFEKHNEKQSADLDLLRNEFRKQVAQFLQLNAKWDVLLRARENPESFLADETVCDMDRNDLVPFWFSRKPKSFYEDGRSFVYVSCMDDVLKLGDIILDTVDTFELFSVRAVDILVALDAINARSRSGRVHCMKLYCDRTEEGLGFFLGEHDLFASPNSPLVERFRL